MQLAIRKWWETVHLDSVKQFLTNTGLKQYIEKFDIASELEKAKTILEIGVGTGLAVREMAALGKKVSVLEVSDEGRRKVVDSVEAAYFPAIMSNMPSDYFDLIISHLVVQHMNAVDVSEQFGHVLRALKPSGVFVFQFANAKRTKDYVMGEEHEKKGGMIYSLLEMRSLILAYAAVITRAKCYPIPNSIIRHYFMKIKKG